jgi:long-chain acyl-CoA synthetase
MGRQTIMEMLYGHAEARPDHLALVYADERISFAELVERIERLAAGLADIGIGAGDSVGLVLRDDPWFVTCFHAITALGAAVVPVNPAFKQDEIEFCFRGAGVRAMIADERGAGVCERIAAGFDWPVEVITTSSAHGQAVTLESLSGRAAPQRLAPRSPDEVYVCQFSSGSTGRPKRVPRTQAQCAAEAELWAEHGLSPDDRVFGAIPLFHTYGMGACLLATAHCGATLVILEEPTPFLLKRHRALELLERERITFFPGVPLNFRLLADAPADADLSSIRICTSAGTALPRETFEAFGERFGVLVRQLYGTTETGIMSTNLGDDPIGTFESVGAPLGAVRFEILDEEGAVLGAGETGEIAVSSPAMTSGYADLPEVNREAFADGRFLTGDLGELDGEGRLYIKGRKKLLIEVGGYKVDPIEVEDVIGAHEKVEEVVVVGVAGAKPGEETVKAVVVPRVECEQRELVEYCREHLANYKVPREVEFRDEIPKSPLGKVLRKYLM